jgi:hypothetical protein
MGVYLFGARYDPDDRYATEFYRILMQALERL